MNPEESPSIEEDLKKVIGSLSKEEIVARLKAVQDIKAIEAANPLLRFRHNNPKQQEFLKFKNIFQFFIGGNKAGKTGTGTYKLVNIVLGKNPDFPHEPPLSCWVCGETRPVLDDTITKQILKWLRPDQYRIVKVGQFIEKIYVKDDLGRESELIYKPYSGGVDVFESANVHAILADEEMPEEIFAAIPPRLLENGAWMMMLMTPTHGITYVQDIIEGVGSYAGFGKFTDYLFTSIYDNAMNLSPKALEIAEASYGHDDAMKRIRMLGQFTSFEGKVYDFREDKLDKEGELESWHAFDLHELPNDIFEVGKVSGFLDYGRSDPFVFCPSLLYPDGTHYFLDEIYQPGLEASEQAEKIKELCEKKWEIKPDLIVADKQIKNKLVQKTSRGETILDIYLNVLGEEWTAFRALEKDKRDPDSARALIGQKLSINPKTGKPYYRFSRENCKKCIKELKRFEWAKAGASETTKGADHCEAGLRYYTKAGIEYDNLMNEADYKNLSKRNRFRKTPPY